MAISISAITRSFVAEIGDVDLSQPLTVEEVAGLEVFWKNYVEYTQEYRREMLA